ncbi:hypothetical protein C6P40_002310 [Pichia californica]|uniref:UBX domain-containing protein 1 n=1 Tax=Pichia californica TaxID=460514 RepID=A0A9P6WJW1_9ASCO|nr:hypothetical protein C6P42_002257 [[Candida] californica]KAG0687457.1 hypothetical protein C6P40_002310 [[Candida] californica]
MSDKDQALAEFIGITGIAKSVAEQYLGRNDYDVESALNDYYSTEHVEPGQKAEPIISKSSLTKNNNKRTSGSVFRSFSDLRGKESNNGDDGDEHGDDDDDMNFFTGGQKSGLAVEDPHKKKSGSGRKLVDDLIEKAQKEAGEPDWRDNDRIDNDGDEDETKKKKLFKGTGHSLGSIENSVDSKKIASEDSGLAGPSSREKVTRTITFWKEGFSIDEGELFKYDDPKNQEYLKQLNMGRAPLSLLNVQMFQDVDVNVVKKLEESYHDHQKSKPRIFGFQGQGQRLGSPIPGEPSTVEEAIAKYDNQNADKIETPEETKPVEPVQQGDTSIQIRLANGERVLQKFNSTDTVEDVYNFVTSKADNSRSWILVTSFPPLPLEHNSNQTIADAGIKNAVVIQKWA